MTHGLRAFIEARLAEDEAVARDAAGLGASRCRWMREAISCVVDASDNGLIVYGEGTPQPAQADHIARHDPARVLREVAAKRAMLAAVDHWKDPHPGVPCTNEDDPWQECELHAAATGRLDPYVLRLLALSWSDHPEYGRSGRGFERLLQEGQAAYEPPAEDRTEAVVSVHKHGAYLPISMELAIDCGMITEDEARAQGWTPAPAPKVSRWRRLRWRWVSWRERVGRKVGGWIAGVDLSEREDDY